MIPPLSPVAPRPEVAASGANDASWVADAPALKRRVITSTAWFAASRVAVQTLSWLVTIVVARFLTPADYGLFAMAFTVITTFELFQEFGLGTAIVQRPEISRGQLNAIFWTVCGASMLLVGVLWVGSGALAAFYGEPRLVGLARVLGLTFLLNAMGLVPFSLLTRAMEFRGRVIAEMLGVVSSLVVCLALAIAGYGVWALVVGYLGKALARNAALFWACDWRPGVRLDRAHFGDIFGFGLRVAGATTIRSLAPVVNQMIIGRALGGAALGLYSMADSIAIGPHRVSSAIIQQISLPLFSRLQRQDAERRRYFLRISKYLTALSTPAQLGLALVASDLVTVLLSAQWLPVVGLLQMLALGAIFFVPSLPAGTLLTAQGRPDLFLRFNCASSLTVAVALLAGTRFGLAGVGVAWLVTFPLARIILLIMGLRLLSLSPWEYLRQIRPAIVAALVMAGCVFAVRAIPGVTTEAFPRLIVETAVGAAAYVAALFALDRPLFREMKSIGHELLARPRP